MLLFENITQTLQVTYSSALNAAWCGCRTPLCIQISPGGLQPGFWSGSNRSTLVSVCQKWFNAGVVITVAFPAHAGPDVVIFKSLLVIKTGILTYPGLNDESSPLAAFYGSQPVLMQLEPVYGHSAVHCPAYYFPVIKVNDRGQIEPAFTVSNISYISQPDLIRPGGMKLLH